MALYLVDHDGRRRRAGRSEPLHLGDVEADDRETAERLAAEKWPGKRLRVRRQRYPWDLVARVPKPPASDAS